MNFIKKKTWLLVLVATAISLIFPRAGLWASPYPIYFLMAIMFFNFLEINLDRLKTDLKNFKKKLAILAITHLVSPVIILLLKQYFSEEVFLGLIIVTVISVGMATVFLSNLFGGISEKALVITLISNLLAPVLVPFLVFIFAKTSIKIDFLDMGQTILKLVLIPAALARLVYMTKLKEPLKKSGTSISVILLFFIILGIVSPVRESIMENVSLSIVLLGIISVLVVINFILGYLLGTGRARKITYAITASYKNTTMASVVAYSLFGPLVALPAIIYTVVINLLLIPLQLLVVKK